MAAKALYDNQITCRRVGHHIASNAYTEYIKMTSFKSIKYEPYQEHRLGTVSNTITRGLKPVLQDPNPRPRSWHGSYASLISYLNNA